MILLAILLALMAERMLAAHPYARRPLFADYLGLLQRAIPAPGLWRSPALPYLVLLPPVALALALQIAVDHPLVDLLVSAALLLLALDSTDLGTDVRRYLEARAAGNGVEAARLARALMQTGETESSRDELVGALFIQSHERLFGPLLWFFAFGLIGAPGAGAVAYRLVSRFPLLLPQDSQNTAAEQVAAQIHAALAWPTARITAALYGLAGSMDDALNEWRRLQGTPSPGWRQRTWAILAEVPAGSISIEEGESGPAAPASLEACLAEVQALQRRALLILLAVFAVFTIGELA